MDLKLLQIFHAVHCERSVSRAAERLGLSQPGISHALRRLRLQLNDPLFVRVPGGVAPTAKGERLAGAVAHALAGLEAAIHEASHFDPASSTRVFRLYMTDIGEVTFLPALMEALQTRAPHLRVEVDQFPVEQIMPLLESGALDFAIGYLPQLPETHRHLLVRERYVLLLRADHPLLGEPVGPAILHRLEYALVRSHAETRRQLENLKLGSKVRLTVPHFLVLPAILDRTALAAILPARLAAHFAARGDLVVLDALFESAALDVSLHWYWRQEHDPGHQWLRALIIEQLDQSRQGPLLTAQ